jgi:iron complex transport system substrate-binding protein
MRAALAKAAPPVGQAPISVVVWQSGGIVPGEGTLIADLLRRTGFTNFASAKGMRQADLLPLERMLADPPRLILSAGDPRAEEDRLLRHPALAALRDTRREPYPSALLWCGGPTVIKAAERLAKIRETVQQ